MDASFDHISPENQEAFERYLMDEMEVTERSHFLNDLEADAQLKSQFLEFKAMFRAIEEVGLRESMDRFHSEMEGSSTKIIQFPMARLYKIAAIVVLLLGTGLWFVLRQNTDERLYKEYFTADPGLPTVMGTNDNYAFYEAMVDYKQGKYKVAIQKWQLLLGQKGTNDTLNYFLGAAHMANGETAASIPFFQRVLGNDGSAFYNDAAFYQALAQLKLGKHEAALENLEKCSGEKARALELKLKE